MRNKILAIAAIAAAIGAPIAAQAQDSSHDGSGSRRSGGRSATPTASQSINGRRSANTSFASECRITPFRIAWSSASVLPEAGVTYYDVPQTFGVTPYRYTVVNGRTVLVEPRSRRIVQVVE